MTVKQFECLTIEEQQDYIFHHAIHLMDRQEVTFLASLYVVDHFYVELFYHHCRSEVSLIQTFTSIHRLERYISTIDITELNKFQ